jgi:hypothetical protein
VSITRLLDAFATTAPEVGGASSDQVQAANSLVLPVWAWLNEAARNANDLAVEWPLLDEAISEQATDRVIAVLTDLARSLRDDDRARSEENIALLHREVSRAVSEAEDNLRGAGIEEQTVAGLFLPIRRELTSWEVRRESAEVLGRARHALSEVGGKQLALNFEQQFAADKRQADRWRLMAFLLFGVAIAWSLAVYLALRGKDAAAADVTARFAVGISLIVVGGVAIRESGRHRSDANVWRTVQLQLNTIDAYCSALPNERADTLRFMLGSAVFAGPRLYTDAAPRVLAEDVNEQLPSSALDALSDPSALAKRMLG